MVHRIVLTGFVSLAVVLAGCSSMGGGAPNGQAQVTVSGVLEPQLQAKAEDVFYRHGFEFKGATTGKMEFERAGGLTNSLLYGSWQNEDLRTRVTLYIIRKDDMAFALRTRSMVVRRSFGGDADDQNFDIQGGRYKVILNKIVKELRQENAAQ